MLFPCEILYEKNHKSIAYLVINTCHFELKQSVITSFQAFEFDFNEMTGFDIYLFLFSKRKRAGFDVPTADQSASSKRRRFVDLLAFDWSACRGRSKSARFLTKEITTNEQSSCKLWKKVKKNSVKLKLPYVNNTPKIHLRSLGP